MGRTQGNMDSRTGVDHRSRCHRVQCCYLPLLALCLLSSGVGFAQVSSDAGRDRAENQQLHVPNPFATPWLLNNQSASANTKIDLAAADTNLDKPLETTKYTLQPDPFNSDLSQSVPNDEARSTPNSRVPQTDTAERLASESSSQLGTVKTKVKANESKYDITRIGDRRVGKKLNFYSLEKEEALGRELSQQVEQQAKLVNDPVVTEYVNRIGQTLVRHSDAKVPFTIKVVDDEQVNAFALPGGFFYVNTGVLLAADNEAELAGVMAHEIAHVAARHATRNATKQDIWNIASLPLIFVGGPVGAAIRQASGIMVPMSFLKFSRDSEREADFLGLEYEYAAGYDPTAFVDFFEKLEAQEKRKSGFIARAFSTHPMNDDRIRRAEAELEMLPARDDYILTTSEFDQVKSRLIRLTRGRAIDDGKAGHPTLRKHTSEEDHPPILRR
jgi:peptidase M48-like protein